MPTPKERCSVAKSPAATSLAAAQLARAIDAANDAFAGGSSFHPLPFNISPREWTAPDVRLARMLARDESYLEYASSLVEDAREAVADSSEDPEDIAAAAEAHSLMDAWDFSVATALKESGLTLFEEERRLFHLYTYISHSPGLEWILNHWVTQVSDSCGAYLQFDNMEDYPIFPVPVALVDLRRLHRAVGDVLRLAGGSWFASQPDEIRSNLSAPDLFKVLLYASELAGDEVWAMPPRELITIKTDGEWGYRELVKALG
jgi:hypothetical protein